MASDIFHWVKSRNRQLEICVYFTAELSTFSSPSIFSKHFHYTLAQLGFCTLGRAAEFSQTLQRIPEKPESQQSFFPFFLSNTPDYQCTFHLTCNIQYMLRQCKHSFPLRPCHSCIWSTVRTSGSQFQNSLIMKECVTSLALLAFREKTNESDRKLRRQSWDLNLGIPNSIWGTAPCTYNVWKPWVPQKIKTKARHFGNTPGDYFPSGILHDLLLQTVCEVLPSGYLLSQFSPHFAYIAYDSSRYLFSTSFNGSIQ